MDQQEYIAAVVDRVEPDQRIRGMFLSGSFGRGTADRFSDIDLLAIADPADHEALAAGWPGALETIAPLVHWFRLPHAFVLSAITEDWLRCDLQIAGAAELGHRAKTVLKPLIDRDGLYAGLPASLPPPQPDPARLRGMIVEFIRVLGLLPVADGRGEYEVATTGAGLLRGMLTNLLIAEMPLGNPGGILHLSRVLDADRLALLMAVPVARPERHAAIEANLATARVFFPRARALAAGLGIAWPETFEAATRRNLVRALPAPFRADW